jgi:hypothetical protein
MQQHEPAPTKNQESARDDEQHKEEMQPDDYVGEKAVGQDSSKQ